jgi:arginine exporter protein ArgO
MDSLLTVFKRGLLTGFFLQLAIGPVFLFIMNLSLQKTVYDGLAGVLAVTLVDYFYIVLSLLGVGKLLEKNNIKWVFGVFSSLILIVFGGLLLNGFVHDGLSRSVVIDSSSIIASFVSVLLLAFFNPMTIILFTGLFTAKAVEYDYAKNQLIIFGLSAGLATFLFMGLSAVFVSFFKGFIPIAIIQLLNLLVGAVLILYGIFRIIRIVKKIIP